MKVALAKYYQENFSELFIDIIDIDIDMDGNLLYATH